MPGAYRTLRAGTDPAPRARMQTPSRKPTNERRGAPRTGVVPIAPEHSVRPPPLDRGHVQGFYSALGLFLSIGLALALLAIAAFVGLAELVEEGATQRFDNAVLLWLNARSTPWLDVAALEVTALGAGLVVWMTVQVASAFLWQTRHHYSAYLLWIAVLGNGLLNSALKAGFDRPRPNLF